MSSQLMFLPESDFLCFQRPFSQMIKARIQMSLLLYMQDKFSPERREFLCQG